LAGETIDLNAPLGPARWPALHQAVAYGWQPMVETLLQLGADPNVRIEHNTTAGGMVPLDFAKDELMTTLLLQAGAMVDTTDKRGMTPIDWARFRRLSRVAEALERFGASRVGTPRECWS